MSDDEELWCFQGCTVQVAVLPYLGQEEGHFSALPFKPELSLESLAIAGGIRQPEPPTRASAGPEEKEGSEPRGSGFPSATPDAAATADALGASPAASVGDVSGPLAPTATAGSGACQVPAEAKKQEPQEGAPVFEQSSPRDPTAAAESADTSARAEASGPGERWQLLQLVEGLEDAASSGRQLASGEAEALLSAATAVESALEPTSRPPELPRRLSSALSVAYERQPDREGLGGAVELCRELLGLAGEASPVCITKAEPSASGAAASAQEEKPVLTRAEMDSFSTPPHASTRARTSDRRQESDRWGGSLAIFEAKAVGCWWPVEVLDPPNFSPKMRRIGLKVTCAYVLDKSDTWCVDSLEGLRPKETGDWSEGLAQCLRGVGYCRHQGCLAAVETIARSPVSPGSQPRGSQTLGGPAGLIPMESPEESRGPTSLVPLDCLPSAPLQAIMSCLDGQSVASLSGTCKTLRAMAQDDRIWRAVQLRAGRHPCLEVEDGAWRKAFNLGQTIDSNWRRRRCNKTEWNDHSDYVYHVNRVGDMCITSSADNTLRVFALKGRNSLANPQADQETSGLASVDADDAAAAATQEAREQSWSSSSHQRLAPEVADKLRPGLPGRRAGSCLELSGHMDHVTCSAALDGGRVVVSVSVDDVVKVWGLPEGKCVHTQRGLAGPGFCKLAAQEQPPDGGGPRLATASMGGSGVAVWDLATWQAVVELDHSRQEFYSTCLPEGTPLMLAAAGDSKVHVWDIRQGREAIAQLEGTRRGSVRCVDAAGHLIVSGGADGSVRMFDCRMWGTLKVLRQHTDLVNTVALDLDLNMLVSGGDDGRICTVQLPSWRACNAISTRVGVLSVAFDHSRLVAGCEDNAVRCWDFMVDGSYMDMDAWSAVSRMVEMRARSSATVMAVGGPPPSISSAATAANHFREGLVSPGAGFPHMNGFHT